MKIAAVPILRRWGFRTVLFGNGILSALSVLMCVLFTASAPFVLIFLGLLIGGFFRSLQYTALNAIAFADVAAPRMSAATSFSSMMQQISNGMGVALAAVTLNQVLVWRGESLTEIPVEDLKQVAPVVVDAIIKWIATLPREP